MDDFSITDARLTQALEEIRVVNQMLGGYRATTAILGPWLLRQQRPVRLLDLGAGLADLPAHLVGWADRRNIDLRVVALEANPVTADYARAWLDRHLPARLRDRVEVQVDDALDLSFEEGAFDVAHASLMLHHFDETEAVALLRAMDRVAAQGVLVNDLHRHPLAYYSIWALTRLLPVSPMFRHDAPLSVRRAFRPNDLRKLAQAADLAGADVRWHWIFRLTLSTL